MLSARGLDFKYGQFTIFAPSNKLLTDKVLLLENDGQSPQTIVDALLFHVSANTIIEDIADPAHCGQPLLMLPGYPLQNEVNQESSITNCEAGKVFQVGPGNTGAMPKVGESFQACDSVVYMLEDALMLPTLPVIAVAPTVAPKDTKLPTRQSSREAPDTPLEPLVEEEEEEEEEEDSGSNSLLSYRESLIFTAFAGLLVAIL